MKWLFGYSVIRLFGYSVIRLFGYLVSLGEGLDQVLEHE
jgi:hypothetical protein